MRNQQEELGLKSHSSLVFDAALETQKKYSFQFFHSFHTLSHTFDKCKSNQEGIDVQCLGITFHAICPYLK